MKILESYSKRTLWTGRVISAICALFLLMDAMMKIVKSAPAVQASAQIGWPEHSIQGIGIVLLVCTILYIIPRTTTLGAVLLTGYLGGATAVMVRADVVGHPYFFPVVFGILVWMGLYLRVVRLRTLIFDKKQSEAEPEKITVSQNLSRA